MKSSLICIVGPTAVGKTEIAIQLAQHLDAEIVSLDSRQIYREMDIGTAKPTPDQRGAVPHHLIDCVNVDQPFSVAEYQRLADTAIKEIRERGKRTMAVARGRGYIFAASLMDFSTVPVRMRRFDRNSNGKRTNTATSPCMSGCADAIRRQQIGFTQITASESFAL